MAEKHTFQSKGGIDELLEEDLCIGSSGPPGNMGASLGGGLPAPAVADSTCLPPSISRAKQVFARSNVAQLPVIMYFMNCGCPGELEWLTLVKSSSRALLIRCPILVDNSIRAVQMR
jgi:hypothetical protein